MSGQPAGDGDLFGNTGLVQFDAGSGQLLVCLDEETRVGPEAGMVLGYNEISGFSGKPAGPFDLFPARCKILAAMRVGA